MTNWPTEMWTVNISSVNSELQRLSCCGCCCCVSHIGFLLYRHPRWDSQLSIEQSCVDVYTPCSVAVINKCVGVSCALACATNEICRKRLVSRVSTNAISQRDRQAFRTGEHEKSREQTNSFYYYHLANAWAESSYTRIGTSVWQ